MSCNIWIFFPNCLVGGGDLKFEPWTSFLETLGGDNWDTRLLARVAHIIKQSYSKDTNFICYNRLIRGMTYYLSAKLNMNLWNLICMDKNIFEDPAKVDNKNCKDKPYEKSKHHIGKVSLKRHNHIDYHSISISKNNVTTVS